MNIDVLRKELDNVLIQHGNVIELNRLYRLALRLHVGDLVLTITGDVCHCCNGKTAKVIEIGVDEYEEPFIKVEFVPPADVDDLECGGEGNGCTMAADHVIKLEPFGENDSS